MSIFLNPQNLITVLLDQFS